MDDNINSIRHFLNEFRANNVEENVKYRNSIISSCYMNPEDVKAEVLDWSLHYLEQKKCPYSLALMLAKLVAHQLSDSVYEMSLQAEGISNGDGSKKFRYESSQLYTEMIECLTEACTNLQDDIDVSTIQIEPPPQVVSLSAIKNTRRKMEDRHVIIHDLNTVCELKDSPRHSYYAIFDGHAGVEAASYCAAHLHWNIINHPEFLTNAEKAISESIVLTDTNLLERSHREGIKGGCTALCCLIRDMVMYIAWVGDSQAVLVKQGVPVPLGLPHKPDREDERCRVEELGGCILYLGTWRVNGTLAVSRSLGDAEHKPYISSEPEILKIALDGTEDYVVLACDGLWDQMKPSDIVPVVYNHIIEGAETVDKVASKLVQLSKSQGSTDNITTIVVFLKDPLNISKPDPVIQQLHKKSEENDSLINGTSPSDAFLNSEEIIKQTLSITNHAGNGISSVEQFNNELNSTNFSQSTVTSKLQENAVTSETLLQQYEHSNVSAASITYRDTLVQNNCTSDTPFSYAQSTPPSLSDSVNSSISQISDSFEVNQTVSMENQQHNDNGNTSHCMVGLNYVSNSTIQNEFVTFNTELNCEEQNIASLMETTSPNSTSELDTEGSSVQSNKFATPEQKVESLNEAIIIQPTTDLQVDPVLLLPVNKDEINQLSEETTDAASKINSDFLNLQAPELCNNETLPNVAALNNCVGNLEHVDNLCKNSNNLKTEVKVPNTNLLHSTDTETFYKQEAISKLPLESYEISDHTSDLYNETENKCINNNISLQTKDLNSKECFHSLDDSGFVANETVSIMSSADESVTCNAQDKHIKVNDIAESNNIQAENVLPLLKDSQKTDCLLLSTDETDYGKSIDITLNTSKQEQKASPFELGSPTILFQERKQLEKTEAINSYKDNLLLCSTDVPSFDNKPMYEQPSQNCNDFTNDKSNFYSKVGHMMVNNDVQDVKISNSTDKVDLLNFTEENFSGKQETAINFISENNSNITDELNMHTKDENATSIKHTVQSDTDTCRNKLNDRGSLLVGASNSNKCELVPELSPQNSAIIAADKLDMDESSPTVVTEVPQNNQKISMDLGDTSETCLSSSLVDDEGLHHEYTVADISPYANVIFKQDVDSKNAIIMPSPAEELKYTECFPKNEMTGRTDLKDEQIRQPKFEQVEKIPIFESQINQVSNGISNNFQASYNNEAKAEIPVLQSKDSLAKSDTSKVTSTKKSAIKEQTSTSFNAGNKRQTTSKSAKGFSVKPTETQQSKIKQTSTNKNVKQKTHEPEIKSLTTSKPKSSQLSVFERLSSPKTTPIRSKETRSLNSSKGICGTIAKTIPEGRTRNDLPQSNKGLDATQKRFNTQSRVSENIKFKASNANTNTKPQRIPFSTHKVISKPPKENLSKKINDKSLHPPEVKQPHGHIDGSVTKKPNSSLSRQDKDTTKQKPPSTKITERALVNTSNIKAPPFKPTTVMKLDNKQTTSKLKSCNSKTISARSSQVAAEKSSISSTKTKEQKTTLSKSTVGHKKEPNIAAKVEKQYQIQKLSTSDNKESSMPNTEGQGDCIAPNNLSDISAKDIEHPKSEACNSVEVPNQTLDK